MKKIAKLCGWVALMLLGAVMTACCDDDDMKVALPDSFVIKPTKAPDFNAYSNRQAINGTANSRMTTRGVDVNGNLWYKNWQRPTNVTETERAKVIEEFSKKREGVKNTLQVTWTNFWVQQVYKGETTYMDGYSQDIGKGSDHMNHLLVFNTLKEEVVSWWPYEVKYTEYEGSYEHINNFNSGDNQTTYTDDETHEQYIGTTLMTNMKSDGRDEQFGYHNSTDSKDHYEYIILEIDGSWYIGFDFYATHPEGQDANRNMDVERDWVFNDWIVKVCPAKMIDEGSETEETPSEPTVTPEPTVYPEPTVSGLGHVEVNLSVNAEKETDDYIATKLSIHVRDTTDVEVFIPVPAEYYCDTDDMDIVVSHREEIELHGASSEVMTYEIDGQTVTMSVTFEVGGIRIQTSGVNAEVLKHLRRNYGDGVTFEVWNYYNSSATREQLKTMFDLSTITFTREPEKFINAFAKLGDAVNPLDCAVTPPASYTNSVANDGVTIGNYNVTYTK